MMQKNKRIAISDSYYDELSRLRYDLGLHHDKLTGFFNFANQFVKNLDRIVESFDYKEANRQDDKKMAEETLLIILEEFSKYFLDDGLRVKIYRIDTRSSPGQLLGESFVSFDLDERRDIQRVMDFCSRFSKSLDGVYEGWSRVIGFDEGLLKAVSRPDELIKIRQPLRQDRGESDFYYQYIDLKYLSPMVINIIKPVKEWQSDRNDRKKMDSFLNSNHCSSIIDNLVSTLQVALNNFDRKALEIHDQITDKRTGLYSPNQFDEQASRAIATSLRLRTPLSMVVMDIDHFKLCNELFGHDIGDRVLSFMGEQIRQFFRVSSTDTAIRYGGEEFVILMQDVEKKKAAIHMHKFKEIVLAASDQLFSFVRLKAPVTYNGKAYEAGFTYPIKFSAGVSDIHDVFGTLQLSLVDDDDSTLGHVNPLNLGKTMFKIADDLLGEVKKHGRDRTIFKHEHSL